MWFETHAHLSDPKFDQDRGTAISQALDRGVSKIVEIGDGPAEWEKAKSLSSEYPDHIWWAGGFHPYFADQANDGSWKTLIHLADDPRFLAIGEVGLDYAKCRLPKDVQQRSLVKAIETSSVLEKPLIIHCREAYEDLIPLLNEHIKKRDDAKHHSPGVIHCFSGNLEEALILLKLGFYLGVDGPITYPSARLLRSVIKELPLERLLLETDSPYLPPQPFRGKRNEPQYLPLIGEEIAHIHNIPVSRVAEVTRSNGYLVFRQIQGE